MQTLRDAVTLLDDGPPDEQENDLNRRLYRAIIAAQTNDARQGLEHLSVVVPEGRNPPAASDAERTAREHKIPDFYWSYVDYLAPDPEAVARQFVVECKRLTSSTKAWNYITQYIDAGVVRFVTEAHGYGKEAPSGAMVGYLQTINLDDALSGVNSHSTANGLPVLVIRQRSDDAPVELDHRLDRPFPVTPFLLWHLWTRVTP
ncbi:MAG: hypothetical protein ACRDNK_04825 [Solirubrobacteraceae bacterium]